MTTSRILATFILVLSGCAAGAESEPEDVTASQTEALDNGSGTTTTKSCEDKYGDCYIDCSLKDTQYKQGCFDSCDASYNLCKTFSVRSTTVFRSTTSGTLLTR